MVFFLKQYLDICTPKCGYVDRTSFHFLWLSSTENIVNLFSHTNASALLFCVWKTYCRLGCFAHNCSNDYNIRKEKRFTQKKNKEKCKCYVNFFKMKMDLLLLRINLILSSMLLCTSSIVGGKYRYIIIAHLWCIERTTYTWHFNVIVHYVLICVIYFRKWFWSRVIRWPVFWFRG